MMKNKNVRGGGIFVRSMVAVGALWAIASFGGAAQDLTPIGDAALFPDAPSARLAVPVVTQAPVEQLAGNSRPTAKKYETTIPAGWQAQPLSAHDKVIYALHDSTSLETLAGIFIAAGYSHVTNGEPNYGTDRGAFGERLGASAARDVSEDIFQEGILAPLLHDDPRYYVEGDRHNFLHRTVYSVTRPLITRGDNGHQKINGSLLLGYAGAAVLTNAYYPAGQRNFDTTVKTYGSSLGGAALNFFFQEFIGDTLQAFHLQKHSDQ